MRVEGSGRGGGDLLRRAEVGGKVGGVRACTSDLFRALTGSSGLVSCSQERSGS